MGLCSVKVRGTLLAALTLSAIALTSCVDIPVPAPCNTSDFSDAEVGTVVYVNMTCNGPELLVEAVVDPDQPLVNNFLVYVEAICTWNQSESAQEAINWGVISRGNEHTFSVENVPNGANCTFAGCYSDYNREFLIQTESCVYDHDECILGEHDCHENAVCENTIGSYECHCQPMFTGNGRNCTENPLATPTSSWLLTPTSSLLPTTTPGVPMEDTSFPAHYLSLLVLVLLALVVSAAVLAFVVRCNSRRKYNHISFRGKVDPDCMLVNPKAMVHHLSFTSLSSELHDLSLHNNDSSDQWYEKKAKYPISQSMLEIQQLSFHLQPTSTSSDGDDSIHFSSLPNIQDSLKTTASPKNDALELPETPPAPPEVHLNPVAAEDGAENYSSLLADNPVDWCQEDTVSNASDSISRSSVVERGTSLGPTHQSDSHTHSLTPDPADAPGDQMDRAAPTDSTELGTPVTDAMAETSLTDSLTHEYLDSKLEERRRQDEFSTDTAPSSSIFPKHNGGLILEEEGGYIEDRDYFSTVHYSDSSCDQREYIDIGAPFSYVRPQHKQGVTSGISTPSFHLQPMASLDGGDLDEDGRYDDLEIDLTAHSPPPQHQMATH